MFKIYRDSLRGGGASLTSERKRGGVSWDIHDIL